MSQFFKQLALLLFFSEALFAGSIPAGYEHVPWGIDLTVISRKYPKGSISKTGDGNLIYRQQAPAPAFSRRLFGFKDGKLNVVSLTFEPSYVRKKGIENILAEQKNHFGECVMDITQAPYMLNCVWENSETRITFAYAPKRPDMTILMYDRKPGL